MSHEIEYHHPMNIGESNVNLSCPEHKYLNVVTNETSDSSVWGQPWYSSSNGSSRIHGYSHSQRIARNLGIFAFLVNRIFIQKCKVLANSEVDIHWCHINIYLVISLCFYKLSI